MLPIKRSYGRPNIASNGRLKELRRREIDLLEQLPPRWNPEDGSEPFTLSYLSKYIIPKTRTVKARRAKARRAKRRSSEAGTSKQEFEPGHAASHSTVLFATSSRRRPTSNAPVRQAPRLHLGHQVGAVDFDGARADVEIGAIALLGGRRPARRAPRARAGSSGDAGADLGALGPSAALAAERSSADAHRRRAGVRRRTAFRRNPPRRASSPRPPAARRRGR